MKYGAPPKNLGLININCREMMFYQDMPIKLKNEHYEFYEKRLECFKEIIERAIDDFVDEFGYLSYHGHYIYLSAKHLFQPKVGKKNKKNE